MESIESFLHADLKDLKDFFAYSLLCCKDFTLSFFYADLKDVSCELWVGEFWVGGFWVQGIKF